MPVKNRSESRVWLAVMTVSLVVMVMFFKADEYVVVSAQSNFVGGAPVRIDDGDVLKARVRLVAGARSNWHSHSWGQMLLVEEGVGRIQRRNGPLRELRAVEPVFTGDGVVHWHGAAPDEDLVMLAIRGDGVEWHESVSDDVYLQEPIR